jgi:hypothetical protein
MLFSQFDPILPLDFDKPASYATNELHPNFRIVYAPAASYTLTPPH